MQDIDERFQQMHMGKLIHIISHQLKRCQCADTVVEGQELTVGQQQLLKFILLETLQRDVYQKDLEEEFQVRKPTLTGMLKLMEKNGFIIRESVERDARLKRIVPTKKAEALRPVILEHIRKTEEQITEGISAQDLILCKKVLCQVYHNLRELNSDSENKEVDVR